MDDKERTAVESEISTEKDIITGAEAIIAADEAKLAADKAASAEAKDVAVIEAAQSSPGTGSDKPAQEAAALDPEGKPATGDTPEPAAPEAAAASPEPASEPEPAPAAAPEAEQVAAEPAAPAAEAPATDLSAGRITPLPVNELGPIASDTSGAGAGETKPDDPIGRRPSMGRVIRPPSIGRIVHYRAANAGEMPDGNEFHAALITKVNEDWTVSLSVFPEGRNPMFVSVIQFGDGGDNMAPGTWCWPAQV